MDKKNFDRFRDIVDKAIEEGNVQKLEEVDAELIQHSDVLALRRDTPLRGNKQRAKNTRKLQSKLRSSISLLKSSAAIGPNSTYSQVNAENVDDGESIRHVRQGGATMPDFVYYRKNTGQANETNATNATNTTNTTEAITAKMGSQIELEQSDPIIHDLEDTPPPCDILYDPCTGKPLEINTLQTLETRVREIRNKTTDHPITDKFPDTISTRLDLLLYLLNRDEPPNSSLFRYTINGQLYEAYWDIVFALSLMDEYERTADFFMVNKKAEHIQANESDIYSNNPIEYLRKRNVNEGASGASDITFCYKNSKAIIAEDVCSGPKLSAESCQSGSAASVDTRTKFYFCSSKFYKRDASKSAESFDIQKIYTAVKNLHQEYDVRIILLVKDRSAVETKLKNARNKYISEEASRTYGERDLFAALTKLYDLTRRKIQGRVDESSLKNILGINDKIKPFLSPRLHQHMAILKIQKAIVAFKNRGGNNKFLVGILPRGGKTYIAGGLVSTLQPKRVVVLLGAKSETISQFTNDLFRYYQDFSDYTVVDVLEGASDAVIDPSKKYIFVMSVELYKMESSSRKILIDLKGGANKADLFICDEAHLKQTTARAIKELEEGTTAPASDAEEEAGLEELKQILTTDVPVVYMTGTYIKPLKAFKIPDDHVAIWEYQDIQEGKNIIDNEEYFKENFPGIYEEALAKCFSYGETYETIQAMYRRFPNLYLLSTQFTDDAKAAFLEQSKGEKVGFPTITHLFEVKKEYSPERVEPHLWHTGFTNPMGMARLINYMSPRPVEGSGAPIKSVMSRIDRISQRIGDRLAFFTKDFVVHSQLWFLPSMQGHPLIKRMTALGSMIFQSPWYRKHFNILAVSSSADWSKIPGAKDKSIKIGEGTFSWACPNGKETLKACILRKEAQARSQGKGLIILAQNMLHLGISLTCVDIVVLLDAGEKVDERIQKMYRALTESTNKKGGYIVDLNYFRTVTAIMNYQIQAMKTRHAKEVYADSGLKDAFNSIIETYSIDDDLDIYGSKEEGGESRIEAETLPELQKAITTAPKGSDGMIIRTAGSAMNRDIEDALKDAYGRDLDAILGELADNSIKHTMRQHGEGVERAEAEADADADAERGPKVPPALFPETVEKNPVEKRKAFMDMFKTAMKIGIFGTGYKSLTDLVSGLKGSDDSTVLKEVIYDTLIKRGTITQSAEPTFVMSLIIRELEDIIRQKKNSSYSGMKEAFNSKDTRKNTFEEVLTYIRDNLTPKDAERHKFGEVFTPLTLVDEMLSKLPPAVWTKKDYKWLDPANGIGNYPIKAFIGQSEGEYKYPGLFNGLAKEIPDPVKRCKWIIEEMLYMVDINGKNNLIAKRLFEKLCPGAKANIEQIDKKEGFLKDKPLVFNGKECKEFDIIMGNPPYQSGAVKSVGTKATRKMRKETGLTTDLNKNLWIPFTTKSIGILRKDGYLLFIHPIGWFKPDGLKPQIELHTLMLSKQICTMRIYKNNQAGRLFGGFGTISMSYYLLQNTEVSRPTEIINILNKNESVLLSSKSVIILAYNNILNKIMKKSPILNATDDFKQKSLSNKDCNDSGRYKNIQKITEDGNVIILRSDKKMEYHDMPKLYIDGINYPRIYYDTKGEYGVIDQNQFYLIGDNLTKQTDFFKTKLSAMLLKYIKYRQDFIEPRYYPDVRELPIAEITDESLADYFGFTQEEREAINAIEYPIREYTFKEIPCAQVKGEKEDQVGGRVTRRKRA
jgi:hypothetical protein